MKCFSILIILVICFSNSCFSQSSKISFERFFENLPNRVYYTEHSLITDTEYQFYYPDVDFRREYNPVGQVFRIPDTNRFGSLMKVNNYYYWVPEFGYETQGQLKIELPGNHKIELSHNQQPLVSSQHQYDMLRKDLQSFSYDMFLIDYYSEKMNAHKRTTSIINVAAPIFGILSYFTLTAETDNRIENIFMKSSGVLYGSIAVGWIPGIIHRRARYNRCSIKRDEIIRKYN